LDILIEVFENLTPIIFHPAICVGGVDLNRSHRFRFLECDALEQLWTLTATTYYWRRIVAYCVASSVVLALFVCSGTDLHFGPT